MPLDVIASPQTVTSTLHYLKRGPEKPARYIGEPPLKTADVVYCCAVTPFRCQTAPTQGVAVVPRDSRAGPVKVPDVAQAL